MIILKIIIKLYYRFYVGICYNLSKETKNFHKVIFISIIKFEHIIKVSKKD